MATQGNDPNYSKQPAEGEETTRNRTAEDPAVDKDKIYLTSDSTLQTPEEAELDKNRKDKDEIIGSKVDDATSNSDGAAGTDRAGTAERKIYGGEKLNKGIEEQGESMTYED